MDEQNLPDNTVPPLLPEDEITEHFIDVQGVFKQKNPRLARWIPGFVFRYLKRVLHQDEVNDLLYRHRFKRGLEFIKAALEEDFKVQVQPQFLERVPAQGRYTVVANHPLGGMDGMALMHAVGQVRKDILFPVNDILMNLPPLRELFIPVNKHGTNKENIQLFNNAFASDVALLFFPAGLVSRKQKGVIKDLEWQKTVISKSIQSRRMIIPAYIDGANSNFFYRLANWRKFFKMKANIEMLYLVDEMFRQRNKTLPIIFGNPIGFERFDRSKKPEEWAQLLREHVYALSKNPNAVF